METLLLKIWVPAMHQSYAMWVVKMNVQNFEKMLHDGIGQGKESNFL